MAHMIPAQPKDFDPASHEGIVFEALSRLPDTFYVFHSLETVTLGRNQPYTLHESDFVVVSPQYGILTIEAKAGNHITYQNGNWYYSNGTIMPHHGPYHQARVAMHNLMNCIDQSAPGIKRKCKFLSAVWFMDLPLETLRTIHLPPEAPLALTLTQDDLADPTTKILSIFNTPVQGFYPEGGLTVQEFNHLMDQVLCPTFHLIATPASQNRAMELHFNSLLREQYRLLDFLEEQSTAVINGAAGTGKTMLAVEKARRHSVAGDAVLFLCYNRLLCDTLNRQYKNHPSSEYRQQFSHVSFMTLSKLALELVGDFQDMQGLANYLADCADHPGQLAYIHIIVDEGQDFGMADENLRNATDGAVNCSVIDFLREAALANGGTFYLFYDKYQMIQGGSRTDYALPECIEDSDCRLTLHTNCRNTREIASTSVTPLHDKKNRRVSVETASYWGNPLPPTLHLLPEQSQQLPALHRVLDTLIAQKIEDVTILTTQTFDYTALNPYLEESPQSVSIRFYPYRGRKYPVTTCIRFKGLESDAVILMDLRQDSFDGRSGLAFYVGASRAKYRLDLLLTLPEGEYHSLAQKLDPNIPNRSRTPERMRRQLGTIFSATVVTE